MFKNAKRDFSRKVNTRQPEKRFLIVCQGEQTEKNYFQSFSLSSATVKVVPEKLDPEKLVKKAVDLAKKDNKGGFDQVWCVFDKDDYTKENVEAALSEKKIKTAFSNPCFELWFLLHFVSFESETTKEILIKEKLPEHLSGYKKNQKGIYDKILEKQDFAIKNAENLPSPENPSTTVYKLVKELNEFLN